MKVAGDSFAHTSNGSARESTWIPLREQALSGVLSHLLREVPFIEAQGEALGADGCERVASPWRGALHLGTRRTSDTSAATRPSRLLREVPSVPVIK